MASRRPAAHYRLAEQAIKQWPRARMPRVATALLTAPAAGVLLAALTWHADYGVLFSLFIGFCAAVCIWLYVLLSRPTSARRAPARRRRRR